MLFNEFRILFLRIFLLHNKRKFGFVVSEFVVGFGEPADHDLNIIDKVDEVREMDVKKEYLLKVRPFLVSIVYLFSTYSEQKSCVNKPRIKVVSTDPLYLL